MHVPVAGCKQAALVGAAMVHHLVIAVRSTMASDCCRCDALRLGCIG